MNLAAELVVIVVIVVLVLFVDSALLRGALTSYRVVTVVLHVD